MGMFEKVMSNVKTTDTAVDEPVCDILVGPLKSLFESNAELPTVTEIKNNIAKSPPTIKSPPAKPRSTSPTGSPS